MSTTTDHIDSLRRQFEELSSLAGVPFTGTLNPALFDLRSCMVGAAMFPTPENRAHRLDACETVSASFGVAVDALLRWADRNHTALGGADTEEQA